MTRKDYQLIAEVLSNSLKHDNLNQTNNAIILQMALALKKDNPNFDRAKFLEACGISDENN